MTTEVIEGLQVRQGEWYVDATLGGGGHTKAILGAGGNVLAIDRDVDAISRMNEYLNKHKNEADRVILVSDTYASLASVLYQNDIREIAGCVFDLGLSITLDKKYQEGLLGLEHWSHIQVIWWFDKNDTPEKRAILQVHPRGDQKNPLTGVFATRSPFRPNLIALTLFDDGAAQLATEFANEDAPLVELGSWVDNGDDTFTLTLTGRPDGDYDAPVVVTFQRDGELVQSIDQQKLYGAEGLRLRLAAAVARAAAASLVSIDLDAGFPLDPTFVSVQGGGEIDASLLGDGCAGFVNRQPVLTVNWTGEAPFVKTFFVSDSDPTLLVLTPDGRLLCNDDANEDLLDPVVEVSEPVTGTYKIWVGSYAKGQLIPGVLVLTTRPEVNLGTFNLGALIQRPLVAEVQPALKRVSTADKATASIRALGADAATLAPGDQPLSASLTVSGTIPLFELGLPDPACNGLVSGVPDFVFNWAGDGAPFSVFFEGESDATLLVLSEDGQLLACGDDAERDVNVNPVVAIAEAKPGLYGVWVGRLNPEQPVVGVLTVSTVADAAPKSLGPVQ